MSGVYNIIVEIYSQISIFDENVDISGFGWFRDLCGPQKTLYRGYEFDPYIQKWFKMAVKYSGLGAQIDINRRKYLGPV